MAGIESERHFSFDRSATPAVPSLKKDSHLHEPILKSKLETDAYKFSMGNVFLKEIPYEARYSFVNRNNLAFPDGFGELLKEQVQMMADLPANPTALEYIGQKWPFLDKNFLDWFGKFRYNPDQVNIEQKGGQLRIEIQGPVYEATHWEVPVLRTVATLYNKMMKHEPTPDWRERTDEKAKTFKEWGVAWADFVTRRPASTDIHEEKLKIATKYPQERKGLGGLIGTSCLEYAWQYGLMPIGTMAHEYIMLLAGIYGYEKANRIAMELWVKEYKGRLGYALPDTFTTDVFLRDFDYEFANVFEGSRQDSGNPYWYITEKILPHYRKLDISPKTKSVIHSNSLDSMKEIFNLNNFMKGEYLRSFGIGGFFGNDVGYPPFNMVIKPSGILVVEGWKPLIKLSDDPNKATGDPKEIKNARRILHLTEQTSSSPQNLL